MELLSAISARGRPCHPPAKDPCPCGAPNRRARRTSQGTQPILTSCSPRDMASTSSDVAATKELPSGGEAVDRTVILCLLPTRKHSEHQATFAMSRTWASCSPHRSLDAGKAALSILIPVLQKR